MENLQSTNKQKKDKSHKDTTYFSEHSSSSFTKYVYNTYYMYYTYILVYVYRQKHK